MFCAAVWQHTTHQSACGQRQQNAFIAMTYARSATLGGSWRAGAAVCCQCVVYTKKDQKSSAFKNFCTNAGCLFFSFFHAYASHALACLQHCRTIFVARNVHYINVCWCVCVCFLLIYFIIFFAVLYFSQIATCFPLA